MRTLMIVVTLLTCLWAPAPTHANVLCRWTGFCLYLSPGFKLTVVDAETGKPLPDVYAWAEWVQYGAHGRGGPLMVQDATSDENGRLAFPRWGPTLGSRGGLLLGIDPAVILFKTGYATLLIHNGVPPGASHHAAIRGMSRNGQSLQLQPFRGSQAEWVEQLRRLVYPALTSHLTDAQRDRFRAPYLKRVTIAATELGKLPPDAGKAAELRAGLELSARFFGGEAR